MSGEALGDNAFAHFGRHRWRSDHSSVRDAAEQLRVGKMVLIGDDVSDSGRYDLICAADRLSVWQTAFLVRHTSGFLQVALRDPVCDVLALPPVAPYGNRMSSQQCVGVDAAIGIGTGISANDRTRTINRLGHRDAGPADFTRPGHVLPVRVATRPPRHDVAAMALTLAEYGGSRGAVFATVVGSAPGATGLMKTWEATDFASSHQLPLIGYTAVEHAGHLRTARNPGPERAAADNHRVALHHSAPTPAPLQSTQHTPRFPGLISLDGAS